MQCFSTKVAATPLTNCARQKQIDRTPTLTQVPCIIRESVMIDFIWQINNTTFHKLNLKAVKWDFPKVVNEHKFIVCILLYMLTWEAVLSPNSWAISSCTFSDSPRAKHISKIFLSSSLQQRKYPFSLFLNIWTSTN